MTPASLVTARFVATVAFLGLSACSGSNGTATDAGTPTDDAAGPDASSNGDAALQMEAGAQEAGGDDGSSTEASTACGPVAAPITHTTDVTTDEVWAAGVHIVPSGIRVKSGGHLTVSACADVRLGAGASITVDPAAQGLDAVGTAAQPVLFEPNDATSLWGAISVTAPATVNLTYTSLTGGGTGPHDSAPNAGASLVGLGTDPARPVVANLQHVTISGSGGLGVAMIGARFDPASVDLQVTGAGWYPIYMGVASATELPSGSYTGNGIDQILLQTYNTASATDANPILSDAILHDRGVPYRVGTIPSSILVGDGKAGSPAASLTIEAGVTVLFTPEGSSAVSQIQVRGIFDGTTATPQGALIVAGTAAAPVVFDSAADAPAAGDWQGLFFTHIVDPRSSIANANIAHAGGYSSTVGLCPSTPAANNGAETCAVILSLDVPPAAFVSNAHIADATCGFYRGWSKQTDIDFVTPNSFAGIPGCLETALAASNGSCANCPTLSP